MPIEAVVYDIGNVLVEWDPHRPFDRLIGPERRRALFAEVDLEAMNVAVDRGADFHGSVEALAARHPDRADEILIWRDHWAEMFAPDIPLSAHLLRRLRARGVPVFALSNFGAATFEIAREAYPVLTEFDRAFISADHCMAKPDAVFYALLEAECGVPPDRLLFADDRPENIDAAAARGWQTHLFADPEPWADRLVAEGLLSRQEATA